MKLSILLFIARLAPALATPFSSGNAAAAAAVAATAARPDAHPQLVARSRVDSKCSEDQASSLSGALKKCRVLTLKAAAAARNASDEQVTAYFGDASEVGRDVVVSYYEAVWALCVDGPEREANAWCAPDDDAACGDGSLWYLAGSRWAPRNAFCPAAFALPVEPGSCGQASLVRELMTLFALGTAQRRIWDPLHEALGTFEDQADEMFNAGENHKVRELLAQRYASFAVDTDLDCATPSFTPQADPSSEVSAQPSTQPSTEASTQPSTQPSTEASTQPSTEVPTQLSTEVPTQLSTQPSTEVPTQLSTQPSTEVSTEEDDTFMIDFRR